MLHPHLSLSHLLVHSNSDSQRSVGHKYGINFSTNINASTSCAIQNDYNKYPDYNQDIFNDESTPLLNNVSTKVTFHELMFRFGELTCTIKNKK